MWDRARAALRELLKQEPKNPRGLLLESHAAMLPATIGHTRRWQAELQPFDTQAAQLKTQQQDFEKREKSWLLAAVKAYTDVTKNPKYATYKRMDQVLFYLAFLLTQQKREDLARLILRIKDELGLAMIWIEHDMQMVADLADRIHVLDYGRTLGTGSASEVLSNPAVIAAYIGTGSLS